MKHVQLIAKNLGKINHLYTKVISKELSALQLNQYFEVLLMLDIQETPVTQNKLAELMQIDKSRIANIIFYLEKRGLICVKTNPTDRREHFVFLSASAKASIPHIEQTVEKINGIAEEGIAKEKLNIFFEVSEIMQQNLLKRNHI